MSSEKRAVAIFALLKLGLQLACLRPYGWFRDELYYVACSEHLAWGYVDHPPLSIVLLRGWRSLVGDQLELIRLGPALVGSLVVALTGLLVIELGGRVLAVSLACLSVLLAPSFISTHHVWSMNSFDQLAWIAAGLLAVRAVTRPTRARWAWLGVVLGLGLLNKWSVLWFGAGLLVGLVATPARATLRTVGPYLAAAIAAALFAPHVLWEARHGWPTLEFMRNALGEKYVPLGTAAFLGAQLPMMNPGTLVLTLAGLGWGVRRRRMNDGALLLACVFVTTLAILLGSSGAKPEYLLAAYPLVFAGGAAQAESWLSQRSPSLRRSLVGGYAAVLTVLEAIALPFALPVLGEEAFVAWQARLGIKPTTSEKKDLAELPQGYADMHGWPELVAQVGEVFAGLTAQERAQATLWAVSGGYGPAAALDFFGEQYGLPPARTGHNTYWLWGPGEGDGRVVVMVGGPADELSPLFDSFQQVATFECRWCMPYENHKPIYVGRGMKKPLAELWPLLKNYQ